jgi:hypothetical protein
MTENRGLVAMSRQFAAIANCNSGKMQGRSIEECSSCFVFSLAICSGWDRLKVSPKWNGNLE